MNEIKKSGWISSVITPALLVLILSQAVKFTNYVSDLESRTLDTVEMKVRLQDHMISWTPVRQEKAFGRLENVEEDVIRLRKTDSLILEALNRIENKYHGK